jgi:hypothetical protein
MAETTAAEPKATPPTLPGKPEPVVMPDPSVSLADTFDRLWGSIKAETAPAKAAVKQAEADVKSTFETRVKPASEELERSLRTPLPEMPTAKPFPTKPDISARPFLSADTKQALPTLVQGLGLIAQMIVGMRGAPAVALKAVSGAMDGWREGDTDRAQREWRSYLESVDQIKYENELALREHEAAMRSAGTNTARAQALFVARMTDLQMPEYALAAAKQDMATTYQDLKMSLDVTSMLEQQSIKASMAQYQHEIQLMNVGIHKQGLDLKEREVKLKEQEAAQMLQLTGGAPGGKPGAVNPTIDALADMWRGGEDMSKLVRGYGKFGTAMGFAVENRAIQKDIEEGVQPSDRTARNRALASNTQALKRITSDEARFQTFLKSFELTVDRAKMLSDKVDRTSVPAWNRRQLVYQANVKGDPDAKNLLSEMEVLARESDRVLSRAGGQGAEHSREEARKLFDPGMTKAQFDSLVANVLRPDALYASMGFAEERQAIEDRIRTLGQSKKPQSPGGSGAGGAMINVVDQNGKPWSVPATTDLSKYPGWRKE